MISTRLATDLRLVISAVLILGFPCLGHSREGVGGHGASVWAGGRLLSAPQSDTFVSTPQAAGSPFHGAQVAQSIQVTQAATHGLAGLSAKTTSAKATRTKVNMTPAVWGKVASTVSELIEKQHYLLPTFDSNYSRRALARYFELLDPDRLYFIQSDLAEFESRFGGQFATDLKDGKLEAVRVIGERFMLRAGNFYRTVYELAGGQWSFSSPWKAELSREHSSWPVDEEHAMEIWTAEVGAELLHLKLEGASPERATIQLQKRFESMRNAVLRFSEKDHISTALLALARASDAHSDYLTQEEFEDAEHEIHLSRIGIGVTLYDDPAGLRVAGVTPGGPAQRDGRLRVNDRIVGVAEEGGSFQEVAGLPFLQALATLKGNRGSLVRLKVLPARAVDPAQIIIVGIRRDQMRSREGEAYAKVVDVGAPQSSRMLKLGWLVVPAFYGDDTADFSRRSSSVSRDVGLLLRRLKAESVSGVVLDFRGNLGGLLDEAIEIGGLFCGGVPIVQVRSHEAGMEVLVPSKVRSSHAAYEGPLVVVTDRGSASASELVAAALQDYGRALVVGGEQTFGKGSVQTTIPLADYFPSRTRLPLGGLILTIGKFYRVNGQSTQLVGVRPDIVLPSTLDLPREGEMALTDPLAHDAVEPLPSQNLIAKVSLRMINALSERSAQRVLESSQFNAITVERDAARAERRENIINLSEAERRESLKALQRAYAELESSMENSRLKGTYGRLLLEDLKLKRLKRSQTDPLASSDPESVATETEALNVLVDLISFDKEGF